MPSLYQVRATEEARAEAAQQLTNAREAGNGSGQFLANTVLFATVLFFAGTSKFEQSRVRFSAATFALAVFVFATIRMVLMPTA